MSKVTIKVEKADDVQVGDLACGFIVESAGDRSVKIAQPASEYHHGIPVHPLTWHIPAEIIQALCASGHVTREVDAVDAVEWIRYADDHWSAEFNGDCIGVVAKDVEFYFKVYDPRFTAAIEAKFRGINSDEGGLR